MYLAIDIGGTKTLLAVFSESGAIIEQQKFQTPKIYSQFLQVLRASSQQLKNSSFTFGAIGVRGTVDREKGCLVWDSQLNWQQSPLVADCEKIFSCDFKLENDSKLAGLSEAQLIKPEPRTVLYISISTGIGSAYLVEGDLDTAVVNSELGKTLYEHEGVIQPWENFASGKAIYEKYGKRASDIDDEKTWNEITAAWAFGLINAAAVYTPELIIIGGGVGTYFNKFIKPLERSINSLNHQGIQIPPIIGAQRAEEAVIYGCYELARKA